MSTSKKFLTAVAALAAAVVVLVAVAHYAPNVLPGIAPEREVVIGVDLPMQGTAAAESRETWDAMNLYLEQVEHRAGAYRVSLRLYDNSTSASGTWDSQVCADNAQRHVANAAEVAVIGPVHVGCLKAQAAALNQAGLLTVSHAVSNPGLTKTWGTGEPGVYAPSGTPNFARVIATDDEQGAAAARFAAQNLGVSRCLVLDDGEVYGKGVAAQFAAAAREVNITVDGHQSWDRTRQSYTDLFGPGPDCVYLAGNFDNNGERLIADKVAALGDNSTVKLLVPDGFGGYPAFLQLPAAQRAYVSSVGLNINGWKALNGPSAQFRAAYSEKYHTEIASSSALYGVLALQVVLAAIEGSDGTRTGVRQAVFGGSGVKLPAATSLLGRATTIDTRSGDIDVRDIAIGQLIDGAVNVPAGRSGS